MSPKVLSWVIYNEKLRELKSSYDDFFWVVLGFLAKILKIISS